MWRLPVVAAPLTYADFIPPARREECLYADFDGLVAGLRRCLSDIERCWAGALREHVARYDWRRLIATYDERLEEVGRRAG